MASIAVDLLAALEKAPEIYEKVMEALEAARAAQETAEAAMAPASDLEIAQAAQPMPPVPVEEPPAPLDLTGSQPKGMIAKFRALPASQQFAVVGTGGSLLGLGIEGYKNYEDEQQQAEQTDALKDIDAKLSGVKIPVMPSPPVSPVVPDNIRASSQNPYYVSTTQQPPINYHPTPQISQPSQGYTGAAIT